ncbi:carbohydrate kinase [Zobellella denitrificans]|jgi:sugar/nucleoside kinase (ribokinase family)|uniref:Carbohydrate kinase n=1 Tax=Zobellella denitrificans TaxID=347534 RepID=A0A231N382_9GAMM|nr:PfkB family carbohydrate kinase [Zobellella denitrificans]ATG75302.1 carbohydrate kinase [Zobellella denitrificans]OXS16595.1 carbohydrate kinase [Zobellella denitrificans]
MAKIVLLANLNCDHVLLLDEPLRAGGRLLYRDQGRRLGGGAANTGVGLLWAGHQVAIASRVGRDDTGDWLCQQARELGLDVGHVERFDGETGELLVLVDSQGERTILRQARRPALPGQLPDTPVDCLYVNLDGAEVAGYMARMAEHSLVVGQYPKGGRWPRPCQVLIASAADLARHRDLWAHARELAGERLQWLVVTHGEQGAEAFSAERHLRVPARPVSVVDATGAGDAFAGGLIHGLVSGLEMSAALAQAGQWAAYTLSSSTSIPSEQLKAYLRRAG